MTTGNKIPKKGMTGLKSSIQFHTHTIDKNLPETDTEVSKALMTNILM